MRKKKLAIVGCGSSGLVTLKYAVEELPDWEIVCFEQTDSLVGCWGRPAKGFVSTSSRFGTQFACAPEFDPVLLRDVSQEKQFADFFRDDEYGDYLLRFADRFELRKHVQTLTQVNGVARTHNGQWELATAHKGQVKSHIADAVVICTGLVNQVQPLACDRPVVDSLNEAMSICNQRVVVVGGGESGVDVARRLSDPALGNDVFLSLRHGVRVSPRYHPIRGVPSDFLRNRMLLSFDPLLRNSLGELFVRLRIQFRFTMGRLFRGTEVGALSSNSSREEVRRYWDLALTRAAKDRLFNVYHNKSDDFLEAVADGRIQIVGGATDPTYSSFYQFDSEQICKVDPAVVVPAVGFTSSLRRVCGEHGELSDYFLGCIHSSRNNLFAIGFARPVIGSIPPISEMQARLVCGLLAGRIAMPDDLAAIHQAERHRQSLQFSKLNTESVYPVEMFPYCDRLARLIGCYPNLKLSGGILRWLRMQLSPATTLHYMTPTLTEDEPRKSQHGIFLPFILVLFLVFMKPVDWLIKSGRAFFSSIRKHSFAAPVSDAAAGVEDVNGRTT